MSKRANYTPEFKTKVVLEVISEEQTVNAIAVKYSVSPVVITRWKKEFLERAPEVFKKGPSKTERNGQQVSNTLPSWNKRLVSLLMKLTGLKKNLTKSSDPTGRKSLVD